MKILLSVLSLLMAFDFTFHTLKFPNVSSINMAAARNLYLASRLRAITHESLRYETLYGERP